jgi:hypothetical protein
MPPILGQGRDHSADSRRRKLSRLIGLRSAKAVGLTVLQTVLIRADEVIR